MKQRGYTLVELLLVISIIAILASLAISIYHTIAINRRVEKAALEMQNFAAAALNYQAEQKNWPEAHDALANCSTTRPEKISYADFMAYLPNESAQGPFGSYYCWGSPSAAPSLFWVALKVPPNNITLAKRIAGRLPNAFATTNPLKQNPTACTEEKDCYVRFEIAGNSSGISSTEIAGFGHCRAESQTIPGSVTAMQCQYLGTAGNEPKSINYAIQFSCPTNKNGEVIASVNDLDVGQPNGDPYVLRTLQLSSECHQNNKLIHCTLKINAARANGQSVATGAHGHIGATYIAYCTPQTTKKYSYLR